MYDLISFLLLLPVIPAKTLVFNWTATWVLGNPDGLLPRPVIGINGDWPCPTIHATVGDHIVLNLKNGLENQTTSLHFHGIYQRGSNCMDGASGVTQCSIPVGDEFTYDFVIDQSGTYWYHSHDKGQYPDGLRGVVVVHDPDSPYLTSYDKEFILTLSEWYHEQMPSLIRYYLSPTSNPKSFEPLRQSAVMNDMQNPKFSLLPGKHYLIRVVNMAAFSAMYLHFSDHDITIVEVDGVYVTPRMTKTLYLAAAQRYSVILEAKSAATRNFAFFTCLDPEIYGDAVPCAKGSAKGTLVYDEQESSPVGKADLRHIQLVDNIDLVPIKREPLLEPVTRTITLVLDFAIINNTNRAIFNNRTYSIQSIPTLYKAFEAGLSATDPEAYGLDVNPYVIKHNEVVEVIIDNLDDSSHPVHLHGHLMQMLHRSVPGVGVYGQSPISSGLSKYPMRRDVVMVPSLGHVVVRFRADNPDKCMSSKLSLH